MNFNLYGTQFVKLSFNSLYEIRTEHVALCCILAQKLKIRRSTVMKDKYNKSQQYRPHLWQTIISQT
jgi:hypothetical protein